MLTLLKYRPDYKMGFEIPVGAQRDRDAIAVWLKIELRHDGLRKRIQLHSHGLVKNLRHDGLCERDATALKNLVGGTEF